MFAVAAALLFFSAFLLAIGVIGVMFASYRNKIAAALLMEPQPEIVPVCTVSVRSRRVRSAGSVAAPAMNAALAA
jgi:hypothetical protein